MIGHSGEQRMTPKACAMLGARVQGRSLNYRLRHLVAVVVFSIRTFC